MKTDGNFNLETMQNNSNINFVSSCRMQIECKEFGQSAYTIITMLLAIAS